MSAIASCLTLYIVLNGGDKVAEVNWHSEQMLDELEKEYLECV